MDHAQILVQICLLCLIWVQVLMHLHLHLLVIYLVRQKDLHQLIWLMDQWVQTFLLREMMHLYLVKLIMWLQEANQDQWVQMFLLRETMRLYLVKLIM
jgi:hypothetical protein